MPRILLTLAALLVAVLAVAYPLFLKPLLAILGVGRVITPVGNTDCIAETELQACEKIVLHQPTGILYLACSTPASRSAWTPSVDRLNASGRSTTDYIATYDPSTRTITHLDFPPLPRGLSVHGMDVVPSSSDPETLFIYAINHRVPLHGEPGADSAVEVFETRVGAADAKHIATVEDAGAIITPNDVVGHPDGRSFHFTNEYGAKTGFTRVLEKAGYVAASVGYCHLDAGCRIVNTHMQSNNGIARAPNNDTFYVNHVAAGRMSILERQKDQSLVVTDVIQLDRPIDNVSVDADGVVWLAGLSDALCLLYKHFPDPTVRCPSSAIRVSINTGPSSFYGEKYKVEKVFEDDGSLASGVTSVVHDARRGLLFLSGVASPQLAVCKF
ncbi:hypothetical protein PLICRDRAFT_36894 [Plicaturopsis crispa FD-325 SS-3]|nr:hypothetical protein PLICRDRAFT_36894 [Plicaturopsis crispa FD-325 SS-3]